MSSFFIRFHSACSTKIVAVSIRFFKGNNFKINEVATAAVYSMIFFFLLIIRKKKKFNSFDVSMIYVIIFKTNDLLAEKRLLLETDGSDDKEL